MNDQIACRFLSGKIARGQTLLLAYSGGPDSEALLQLLLRCKEQLGFDLHLAHVDHGWRGESAAEAKYLEAKASKLGLSFHCKRLLPCFNGNLEERCRVERLLFFRALQRKYGFAALLLAHQADDVIETALKRILEGAHLPNCYGLEKESAWDGMRVWRPLLDVSKKELLQWLQSQNYSYLEDASNNDTKFLRARMRKVLLPHLAEAFGKNIQSNLLEFSRRSLELRNYLDDKIAPAQELVCHGSYCSFLDMAVCLAMSDLEKQHFLKKLCASFGLDLSRENLGELLASKSFFLRHKNIAALLQAGYLFFIRQALPEFKGVLPVTEGCRRQGKWQIEVQRVRANCHSPGHWRSVLDGHFTALVPVGSYELRLPQGGDSFGGCRLNKWLAENRVPLFLRSSVPVLYKDGQVFCEFLSGRNRLKPDFKGDFFKIYINY